MYSADLVAKWFLEEELDNADEDGEGMSNLKLQKLLYYAQGVHAAATGKRLFPEEILAWVHGPAVKEVYARYKGFGAGPIELEDEGDRLELDEDTEQILRDVYGSFGQFTAWKLREMSLSELPWLQTERGASIPVPLLIDFFRDNYFEVKDDLWGDRSLYAIAFAVLAVGCAIGAVFAFKKRRRFLFWRKKSFFRR